MFGAIELLRGTACAQGQEAPNSTAEQASPGVMDSHQTRGNGSVAYLLADASLRTVPKGEKTNQPWVKNSNHSSRRDQSVFSDKILPCIRQTGTCHFGPSSVWRVVDFCGPVNCYGGSPVLRVLVSRGGGGGRRDLRRPKPFLAG